MDSMQDLLRKNLPNEPPQIAALKKYVAEAYGEKISVRTSATHYLITVPGAALASRLRVETSEIAARCQLDKKLVIHIGY